ncbi:hypothetical protein [Caudoviricetes sp.]|nr:hypothetical protein [Caudoviricetes sp.]UOF81130.1 hypothetical protein [Caudoviricetes sp.]UOF82234.1 hypothetical protein [Caudoviricetes sp.]UOF82475.1 hypothetical protein [Caudoviricetes sp.]UOF82629.1 hypothetical protein [Caudoviricetes sp.]
MGRILKSLRKRTTPSCRPRNSLPTLRGMSYGARHHMRQAMRKGSCSVRGHGKIRLVEGVGRWCHRCGEWVEVFPKEVAGG